MAGDWIPIRLSLSDDPAVIAIAAALAVDEDLVVGKLHRFWSWANQQTEDGNALGVTDSWIDRYVRMPGFARQLESVGWLSITPAGVTLPRFDRYNGQSGKKRAKSNERVAAFRERKRFGNAGSVTESVTREEKRREDKEKTPIPPHASRAETLDSTVRPRAGGRDDAPSTPEPLKRKSNAASVTNDPPPPGFAEFWKLFPDVRRAGKTKALAIWRRQSLEDKAAAVLDGLRRWLASAEWHKDGGQYVPAPVPWLNGCKWEAKPLPRTAAHSRPSPHGRHFVPAPAAFPPDVEDQ